MITHQKQIAKNKTMIIVELEEIEMKELEKGEPITIQIETTFHNQAYGQAYGQVNRKIEGIEELKEKLKL